MSSCPQCGAKLASGAHACAACGATVKPAGSQAIPAAVSAIFTHVPHPHIARRKDFVNMVNTVLADKNLTAQEKKFLLGGLATHQGPIGDYDLGSGSGSSPDYAILALAFGFDAYFSSDPSGGSDYLTILNRTALRLQSTAAKAA